MNECEDSGNLCDSNSSLGQARYIPPHLRGGGGNNNSAEPEQSAGNRNYNNREYRDYNRENHRGDNNFRGDNRDYRNDNR